MKSLLSEEDSAFEEALALVSIQYTLQPQSIKPPAAVKGSCGRLFALTTEELDQLRAMQDLIVRYVVQRSPARPLCLAVFGPPGSGKSFAVKQI